MIRRVSCCSICFHKPVEWPLWIRCQCSSLTSIEQYIIMVLSTKFCSLCRYFMSAYPNDAWASRVLIDRLIGHYLAGILISMARLGCPKWTPPVGELEWTCKGSRMVSIEILTPRIPTPLAADINKHRGRSTVTFVQFPGANDLGLLNSLKTKTLFLARDLKRKLCLQEGVALCQVCPVSS